MVAFELRLLVGVHRVAEEHPAPFRALFGPFDPRGVRELASPVREDDGEQPRKKFVAEVLVEAVEDRNHVLRALAGDENGDHERRRGPMERQEAFPADAPDDEVHEHDGVPGVSFAEGLVRLVVASDVAALFDLVRVVARLCLALAHHARALHVAALGGEQPVVEVTRQRAFVLVESPGARDADVVHGLSGLDGRRDDRVQAFAFAFGEGRAPARLGEKRDIAFLRAAGDVEVFAHVAPLLVGAAVADLAGADEPLSAADALALVAQRVAPVEAADGAAHATALRVPAQARDLAVLPVDALVRAQLRSLVARVGVFCHFAGHRGRAVSGLPGDELEGLARPQPGLDFRPVHGRHVFFAFDHVGDPFLVFPRRNWRDAT